MNAKFIIEILNDEECWVIIDNGLGGQMHMTPKITLDEAYKWLHSFENTGVQMIDNRKTNS